MMVTVYFPIGSLRALIGGEKKYSPPRDKMNAGIVRSWLALSTSMPEVTRAAPLPAWPMIGSRPGVESFFPKMKLVTFVRKGNQAVIS